ncbi:3-propionate hydroxylase [Amylocarpus encephaloides]|uniref:3-propionate hydroxylase n=1 Tax=Amylocarpus encephaloides TaxID=45428 RepID=A0A9P7YIV7_9HELO|nr:3-propionate hydroxylase [Amylocarpus encephaloides]
MAPHFELGCGAPSFAGPSSNDIPVLIIGGGPCGLLLAHMLSKLNVESLVLERYPARLAAPKAHALSPRTLEICRQFHLDVNLIRNLGTKRNDAYWVNFVANLSDHVASIPYERMDAEVLADTPTMIHNIAQPTFEELVTTRLQHDGKVEIRKNHSFVSCEQHKDQVITTVENRTTGKLYGIRSRHLVACDGAKSKVRENLGIDCEGESSYETMMTIHFNADLRLVIGENLGMLHWVMDPEVSGFIIGYDLDHNQVLICNLDPKKTPLESWSDELCRKTVTAAIGTSIPFDVLSYRPWVLSRKVAESYRVGNVFLAGDAAHSFPPTGGLGLNSGLGDVGNLAYKIAAVHQGWGGSTLLHTYQDDRRHVALVNAQQSVKNGKQIFSLLKTLGTTVPDVEIAKANLRRTIANPASRKYVCKGIEAQREHFDNLGLHIGYIYGDVEIPASASLYKPSYRAGARLPHAWLIGTQQLETATFLPPIDSSYVTELTPEEVAGKRYSTLDLCAFDAFTLLVDESFGPQWTQNLQETIEKMPKKASSLRINAVLMGRDFNLVPGARAGEWLQGTQLKNGHAVLVRPDQHILNTFLRHTTPEQLSEALMQHLDL